MNRKTLSEIANMAITAPISLTIATFSGFVVFEIGKTGLGLQEQILIAPTIITGVIALLVSQKLVSSFLRRHIFK